MPTEKKKDLSQITVHMIGNAHIDPVWQWRWEEGRQEVLDSCWAAVDRIKDTPGFIFCRSSAVTYQWIEQEDPELFAEIKRWVARGRWVLVNGWWEQPDCNIPSGESLVRHGLYGQRYFMKHFGVMAKTGWNVDTFGHAGTIPQILLGQGMTNYVFCRPDPNEKALPEHLFWWESMDGSRVLAARVLGYYGTWSEEITDKIVDSIRNVPKGMTDTLCLYGVGNHGGGPTIANIECIKKVAANPKMPNAIFGNPDIFFDKMREKPKKIPVVSEELQYHSRGCYTSVTAIKHHNRLAENLLLQAEKLATITQHNIGMPYPADDFEYGWKKVLFNQFHDIMAGTSIRPACDDAIDDYREAEMLARRVIRNAMTRISAQIDAPGDGRPIVVYNTLSWERTEVVETEVSWTNHDDCVHIVDEAGNQVPFQILHTCISGRGMTIRVAFEAQIPACGYRTYRMLQGPGQPFDNPFRVGSYYVESDLLRLEFDLEDGYLVKLLHKPSNKDLLAAPALVPLVITDPSDTWSHGIVSFRDEAYRFSGGIVEIIEAGPVRAHVKITFEDGDSTMVQDVFVTLGTPQVDVLLTVDYHGEHEYLKLAVPTAVTNVTATYDSAYGFTVRAANGSEEPAQKWADVTGTLPCGTVAGLALLNDGRYGYDILDGEIRLSVLRTPIYCFHDPAKRDPRLRYEMTDQGFAQFTCSLLPHMGDWREGDVVRHAHQLNQPCLVREEPAHKGKLPAVSSFATASVDNVIIEVIKQQEDGNGLTIRAWETAGQATECELTLAGQNLGKFTFRPTEIKTLQVLDNKAKEVNLLEW